MKKATLSPDEFLAEAELAANSGKLKTAIKHLKNYLKTAKDHQVLVKLAVLYEKTDDDFNAAQCWKSACEISKSPAHYRSLAKLRNRQLLHQEAMTVLDEALKINPSDVGLHEELVFTLSELKLPLTSAAEELLKLDPKSCVGMSYLGKSLHRQGLLDEAEDKLNAALMIDQNNPWAMLFMAELKIACMQFDSAFVLLERSFDVFNAAKNEHQCDFISGIYDQYKGYAEIVKRKVKFGHLSMESQLSELTSCGLRLKESFNLQALMDEYSYTRDHFEQDPFLQLLIALVGSECVTNAEIFNVEAIHSDGDYVRFLEMFKRIAEPNFPLTECGDQIDLGSEGGSAKLSFVLDGKRYDWRAKYDNDWLDENILHRLGGLLIKRACGASFIKFNLGGEVIVMCIDTTQIARLRENTSLDFEVLNK